jgi:peroxiredoxin
MKTGTRCAIGLLAAFATASAWAIKPGDRVDNFTLVDDSGKSHELYSLKDRKAVVLMVQGNGCPIVRQAIPALRDVRDHVQALHKGNVEFLLINSNLQDNGKTIAEESKEFEFKLPVLVDSGQKIGMALDVNRTAEVFVITTADWKLAYRGPVDDRISYEKQRPAAQHTYLKDALLSVLNGTPVKYPKVDGPGCIVNLPERDRAKAMSGQSSDAHHAMNH